MRQAPVLSEIPTSVGATAPAASGLPAGASDQFASMLAGALRGALAASAPAGSAPLASTIPTAAPNQIPAAQTSLATGEAVLPAADPRFAAAVLDSSFSEIFAQLAPSETSADLPITLLASGAEEPTPEGDAGASDRLLDRLLEMLQAGSALPSALAGTVASPIVATAPSLDEQAAEPTTFRIATEQTTALVQGLVSTPTPEATAEPITEGRTTAALPGESTSRFLAARLAAEGTINGDESSGAGPAPGKLPVNLLPAETRTAPIKLLGDRFARLIAGDERRETPINPSVLTKAELAAPDVSVEDRNATVLARIDRFEFVERVAKALEQATRQSPAKIEIELNPPSLGRLKLEVTNRDGELTARIETTSAATRGLIADQTSTLSRHLEAQGITIQRIDVEVSSSSSADGRNGAVGAGGQMFAGDGERRRDDPRRREPRWLGGDEPDADRARPLTMAAILAAAPGMDRVI